MNLAKRIGVTAATAAMLLSGLATVSPAAGAWTPCGTAKPKTIPVPKGPDPRWVNAETCIDVDGDGVRLTGEMSGYLLLCNVNSGTKCNSRNRTRSAPARVVIGLFVNWNGGGTKHQCDITKAVRAQIKHHRDYVEYHCKLTLKPVKHRRYWGHGHIGHDVAGDGKGSYWIFTGQTAYYTPRP